MGKLTLAPYGSHLLPIYQDIDFPILDPYSSHMDLPMWVQHGTMLQTPHQSLMGCPYRTHINTHLGPVWVLYALPAG